MEIEVLTDGLREVGASVSAIPAQVADAAEPAVPGVESAIGANPGLDTSVALEELGAALVQAVNNVSRSLTLHGEALQRAAQVYGDAEIRTSDAVRDAGRGL